MSVGAPPAGPPQAARAPVSAATHSFPDLHSLAADVQSDLGALATGLAHAGASADVVQKISQMAGTVSEVTHILSSAPPIPNPAHAQAQAAAQQQQASQPQAQPNQPQSGGSANPHKALASAVSALAQHAAANAQQPGQ